jgi:hypothetical protein
MRIIIGVLALGLLMTPALADDIAKLPGMVVEGEFTVYEDQIDGQSAANALVVSVIEGTFTDQGPKYVAALELKGLIVDLIYDPYGVWPDISGYSVIIVDHADDWWGTGWVPADEDVLAAWLGGPYKPCLIFIGQDYMYWRGTNVGFPLDYMGIADWMDDLNYGDPGPMDWQGTLGGILDGKGGSFWACFEANPFFTDWIGFLVEGMVEWQSPLNPVWTEGGSVLREPLVTWNVAFSGVEFGCIAVDPDNLGDLALVVDNWMKNLCKVEQPTATQESTWGQIKSIFK